MGIEQLIGKTLRRVKQKDGDQIYFYAKTGETYLMNHPQDCCESVGIEDACGSWDDIVESPILSAEEVTSSEILPEDPHQAWSAVKANDLGYRVMESAGLIPNRDKNDVDSFTWTFYKIDTIKGGVTIRWYGSSNGYYSERVYFEGIK